MSTDAVSQRPQAVEGLAAGPRPESPFCVRFRGVRGSYAVPGRRTIGVGGNTPCVEVRAGGHVLIFDAGTGIIELGQELLAEHLASGADAATRKPLVATLFFSHLHHDHTQGFPFFVPVFMGGAQIHVLGPRLVRQDLKEALTKALLNPFFPVDLDEMTAELEIRNLEEDEAVLFAPGEPDPEIVDGPRPPATPEHVVVRTARGYCHPGGVRYYRVDYRGKSVVYATDTEGYVGGDVNLASFAAGADLLIHDAQYREAEYVGYPMPKQGFGHSTPAMAAAVAASAGVGRLVLFHHDPKHDDATVAEMEQEAKRLFAPSLAAYEGLCLEL